MAKLELGYNKTIDYQPIVDYVSKKVQDGIEFDQESTSVFTQKWFYKMCMGIWIAAGSVLSLVLIIAYAMGDENGEMSATGGAFVVVISIICLILMAIFIPLQVSSQKKWKNFLSSQKYTLNWHDIVVGSINENFDNVKVKECQHRTVENKPFGIGGSARLSNSTPLLQGRIDKLGFTTFYNEWETLHRVYDPETKTVRTYYTYEYRYTVVGIVAQKGGFDKLNALVTYGKNGKDTTKFENEEFNKMFTTVHNNPAAAYKLFTPAVQEGLVAIFKKTPKSSFEFRFGGDWYMLNIAADNKDDINLARLVEKCPDTELNLEKRVFTKVMADIESIIYLMGVANVFRNIQDIFESDESIDKALDDLMSGIKVSKSMISEGSGVNINIETRDDAMRRVHELVGGTAGMAVLGALEDEPVVSDISSRDDALKRMRELTGETGTITEGDGVSREMSKKELDAHLDKVEELNKQVDEMKKTTKPVVKKKNGVTTTTYESSTSSGNATPGEIDKLLAESDALVKNLEKQPGAVKKTTKTSTKTSSKSKK